MITLMNEKVRDQVYAIVRLVPAGRVVSYGDIAGMLEVNPRQVGRFMGLSGPSDDLPWWRITNSAGDLPAHLLGEAIDHWDEEAIPVRPNERGCRIRTHRADLAELADAAERLLGPLPGVSGTASCRSLDRLPEHERKAGQEAERGVRCRGDVEPLDHAGFPFGWTTSSVARSSAVADRAT